MILSASLVILFVAAFAAPAPHQNVVNFSVGDFCNLAHKDCGSVAGKVVNVSFNGTCTPQGIAILKKGTNIVIDFAFQAYNSEAVLTSDVYGKVGPLPFVHFKLGNPDACKDSNLACPIPANTTLDYKPILNVSESYPAVNVIVKWELKNKANADIFCVLLPAIITD
jgi:hypothetical protein